jgi:glucose-1-phosphate thymidylyltransferase
MKGVILAGGFGNRLKPLTEITNKHLLPVYDKPVIFYPLQTLLNCNITDILIVTGPEYAGGFMKVLGSGEKFGCNFYFAVQEKAGGIADALKHAEKFIGTDSIAVILGDNIFENDFKEVVSEFKEVAMLFLKAVHDPERFGVAEMNEDGNVARIVEKPLIPPSPYAVTGFYIYDNTIFDIIRTLKPSKRGELEITDVNNA